jgi:hypothetical protein
VPRSYRTEYNGLVNLSHNTETIETIGNEDIEKSEAIVYYTSPLVEISLGNDMKVRVILDSGSDVNLLAQSVYDKLIDSRVDIPTLSLDLGSDLVELRNRR